MSRTPPDLSDLQEDQFDLWFQIKNLADEGKWSQLIALLDEDGAALVPRHALTKVALWDAVVEGERGVVERLLAHGYVPEEDDIRGIMTLLRDSGLERMTLHKIAPVLKIVVNGADFDHGAFLIELSDWTEGVETVLPLAYLAGIDAAKNDALLRHIMRKEYVDQFQWLCEIGVSIYAPAVVAFMQKTTTGYVLRQCWRDLCAADRKDAPPMLARLLPVPPAPFRAGAFLNPMRHDAQGAPVTLLGVMVAEGRVAEIFADPARWAAHPVEATLVYKALAEYDAQQGVTLGPLQSHLRQQRMQAARGNKPGLRL